ncbi:hypothetical protein AB0I28_13900 [Phytomonospora sp. NPDC050363]|uniref:hypothetical protein n=1 Tax=Phytomonospora sp. NPDC050363 TaxID=3155642 RepID=UPI0033ECDD7D
MTGKDPSDLDDIKAWWRRLKAPGFVTLPLPKTSRYSTLAAEAEARELLAKRGLPATTSFAYWLKQRGSAFDYYDSLKTGLVLHWGGDHEVVRAVLGDGPSGFAIADGGADGPFVLDKAVILDAEGFPDPDDAVGVRQLLERLAPEDRKVRELPVEPLTEAEEAWLHARLREPFDVEEVAGYVNALERRQALTYDEADRLLTAARASYGKYLRAWGGLRNLLRALLRFDHPEMPAAFAEYGPFGQWLLREHATESGMAVARGMTLGGEHSAVSAWLANHRALRGTDAGGAVAAIAPDLLELPAPERDEAMRALYSDAQWAVATGWPNVSASGARLGATIAAVRLALDERLPHDFRVMAGRVAAEWSTVLREAVTGKHADYAARIGSTTEELTAELDRFEAVAADLLEGTGPDLTAHPSELRRAWWSYRTLDETDVAWLRGRIGHPETGLQGVAFCLELLYSHGLATVEDVDALVPRWKTVLAKKYPTQWTLWRHPMVTLTCLARDLGHPLTDALDKWWTKAAPRWKDELFAYTYLGEPDEDRASRLWKQIESGRREPGRITTWVLMRARLDGVTPAVAADRLLASSLPRHLVEKVLIAVSDPAQPLWSHGEYDRVRGWWDRAVEIAENPELSADARGAGVAFARAHSMTKWPGQVFPPPTDTDVAAAREWLAGQGA